MSWPTKILLALGALLLACSAAQAATIPVTTTADGIAADATCTLREAVFAARFNQPTQGCLGGSATEVDTIVLGPGRFELEPTPGGTDEEGTESGDLDIVTGNDVRIVGAGAGASAIDALLGGPAFEVFQGAVLTLDGLTVRRGRSGPGAPGGAIQNQGTLIVVRAAFEDNAAGAGTEPLDPGGAGGAIWSGASPNPSVLIADTVFRGNAAGAGGDGRVLGPNSTSGGGRGGDGGAIVLESGIAEVSATTFVGNKAGDGGSGSSTGGGSSGEGPGGDGGAIAVAGPASASVTNSTFSGNAAGGTGASPFPENRRGGEGGAAAVTEPGGSLRITWSTFAGNTLSPQAPATGARAVSLGQVSASIVADAAPACRLSAPAVLANVVLPGDRSCAGPQVEGDPRLGALAANGGPTPTMLPGPGSAAVNALAGVPCPGTDQRGLPRPALGACDAGAVEVQPSEPAGVALSAPPRPGVGVLAARRVFGLSMSSSTFRAARSGASVGKATKSLQAKAPIGTTVRYRLDGAARLTFTITKPAPGRRKARRCVRPGAAKPGATRCVRTQKLTGSFAHQGAAGQNAFRFTGRLRG